MAATRPHHPVVVVGAGPVGLSLAIDLAQRGQSVVLLDDADRIGEGSRAICFSKRSLEYWDRLGIGQRMVDKGVVWSVGKIFHGASQLYQFNLLPEEGHKRPAFINLQQFYAEAYLVDRVQELVRDRPALAQQGDRAGAAQRSCAADGRDAGRALPDACRFRRRLRRRALVAAADGRRGIRRTGVRGPVPDRRRQDDGGVPDRALVLVRSAVPRRPLRAAAQAAGRHLAHRPAAQPVCRSRVRKAAGERAAADRAHARARQVRIRMDLALQVPVPPDGQVRPWPRDLCRRRRASGFAVRRPRRQFGPGRRRESSPGNSIACCGGRRRKRCSRAITPSAAPRPTRTSANRPARPISWRRNSHQEARLRKAVLSLAKETEFGKRMVNGGRLSVPSVYETPLSTADTRCVARRPAARRFDAGCAGGRAIGEPAYLTDAFIRQGKRFTLLAFANGAAVEAPDDVGDDPYRRRGRSCRFRRPASARATMPSPAPPICCVPTAMSPRASGNRRGAALDAALARAAGHN